MKIFKIISIFIFSILFLAYLGFLFVLPNVVNISEMKEKSNLFSENSSCALFYDDVKLFTTYDFQIGFKFKNLKFYPDKKKELVSLSNAVISVKLLPLFLKKIELGRIILADLDLNILVTKDNKIHFDQFLSEKIPLTDFNKVSGIKFSSTLPDIMLSNYKINLIDEVTNDKFNIIGKKIKITGSFDKSVVVKTDGNVKLNQSSLGDFDIKVDYEFPKDQKDRNEKWDTVDFYLKPFSNIAKYNFKSKIKADLKVTQKEGGVYLKGFVNADDVSFKINGVQSPKSYLHTQFDKKKIFLKSDFYVNSKDKISVSGDIKTGKKSDINLDFNAKNVNLNDVQTVGVMLMSILDIDNPLKDCIVTGTLNSDFRLATDMKKIQSSGELFVKNVEIKHKQIPFKINKTSAKINFNNNKIKIEDATAFVNGSLLKLEGSVDSLANADIHVFSNGLPVSQLYKAFAPAKKKNLFSINSGVLDFNIYIKGKFDKIAPKIKAELRNLSVKDNSLKAIYDIKKTDVNIISKGDKDFSGTVDLNGIVLKSLNLPLKLNVQKASVDITPDFILIKPLKFSLNSQSSILKGQIQNYNKNPDYRISVKGGVKSQDIKDFIPLKYKNLFVARGVLEYVINLKGDLKKSDIKAQVLSSPNNYLSVIDIKSLNGKNALTSAVFEFDNNVLKLSDITLNNYGANALSDDLKNNLTNSSKILSVKGSISKVLSKNPYIDELKINLVKPLTAGISGFKNSTVSLKGNLDIKGNVSGPLVLGDLSITNLSVPDFSLKSSNIDVSLGKNTIKVNSPGLNVANSSFAVDLDADSDFSKMFLIKNLNINSTNINVEDLFKYMNNLPEAKLGPGADLPVKINKGRINAKKIKYGEFVLTDASSDFTLLKNVLNLNNFTAEACKGVVSGDISYNFTYMWLKAHLKGASMSANRVFTTLFNLENQVVGNLSFDTNVMLSGASLNDQIRSLTGYTDFTVTDGQMGPLGKFEHFINAQNLLSMNIISKSLATMIKVLAPQNTGRFETFSGKLVYKNGYVNLSPVILRGPQMAFIIDGRLNLLNNYADMVVLGRISQDVANAVSPLTSMSLEKLLENTPTLGSTVSSLFTAFNVSLPPSDLNRIPSLTRNLSGKLFRVIVYGDIQKMSAVKSFKWVNSESATASAQSQMQKTLGTTKVILNSQANFVKSTFKKGIKPLVENSEPEETVTPQNNSVTNTEKLNDDENANKQFNDLMNALPD